MRGFFFTHMSHLRIAFVGSFYKEAVNGVVNAGYQLALNLAHAGVKIFIYSLRSSQDHAPRPHEHIQYRFFRRHRFPLLLSVDFKEHLKRNIDQIDLVHLHSVFIPLHYPLVRLLLTLGIPYVITPHGGYIRPSLAKTLSRNYVFKRLYIQLIEKFIVTHAQALIALVEREASDIRSFGFAGEIAVIPNSNPSTIMGTFPPAQPVRRFLLFLGRYDVEAKGLVYLLDLFKELAALDSSLELQLHGQGKDKSNLEQYVADKQIPRVHIGDPVYGDMKVQALQACTIYIQPSSFEVFGLSIIEAMLSAKAVAISRGCYLSSLFEQNHTGFVLPVEPGEAAHKLFEVLRHPDELIQQGVALRNLALKEFDVGTITKNTITLYRKIIKKGTTSEKKDHERVQRF